MYKQICDRVYLVGGSELSNFRDCQVYLVDLGETILIDCGAGPGWPRICTNIIEAGFDLAAIHSLILTHCHVDHIGVAMACKEISNCRIIAHELDTPAIETGDSRRTASNWYNIILPPCTIDQQMTESEETLNFSQGDLKLIHTPGHTPGSMVVVLESDDGKVLFGQDIHGPFNQDFDSSIPAWRKSMRRLIDLEADILCEGHYGVFKPAEAVRDFIEGHLRGNS